MKTKLMTAAFICICAISASAAHSDSNHQNIEQKKTEILQHIQERITNSEAEIVCVKSAQSHDELRTCKEKFRPPLKNDKHNQIQSR